VNRLGFKPFEMAQAINPWRIGEGARNGRIGFRHGISDAQERAKMAPWRPKLKYRACWLEKSLAVTTFFNARD
jgi:hypothetical protein